jgi:hypothetical protein
MILKKRFLAEIRICAVAALCIAPCLAYGKSDKSIDDACRPRWDRFVVDEKATKWDASSDACAGILEKQAKMSKLYGAPKIYGEFEEAMVGRRDVGKLYGAPDNFNARSLYGSYEQARVGTVRKVYLPPTAPTARTKHADKAVAVSKSKQKTARPAQYSPNIAKPEKEPVHYERPATAEKTQKKIYAPAAADGSASIIAKTLNERIDTDSYCLRINPPVLGPMPKGFVLMPGREDMMSCVRR